jgi:hypothetical protein
MDVAPGNAARADDVPAGSPRVLAALRSDDTVVVTRRQQIFAGATLNVLVNVVVLNLFVEFADRVVIDSFWISVLTAVLLTVMIGLLSRVERRVHHFFFDERGWKLAGVLATWLLLFGSKFVILEVVDIVFGDHVELGKLLEVILIVLTMMVAAQLTQTAYAALGQGERDGSGGDELIV